MWRTMGCGCHGQHLWRRFRGRGDWTQFTHYTKLTATRHSSRFEAATQALICRRIRRASVGRFDTDFTPGPSARSQTCPEDVGRKMRDLNPVPIEVWFGCQDADPWILGAKSWAIRAITSTAREAAIPRAGVLVQRRGQYSNKVARQAGYACPLPPRLYFHARGSSAWMTTVIPANERRQPTTRWCRVSR